MVILVQGRPIGDPAMQSLDLQSDLGTAAAPVKAPGEVVAKGITLLSCPPATERSIFMTSRCGSGSPALCRTAPALVN